MASLNEIYLKCLTTVPRWSLPENAALQRRQLKTLALSDLSVHKTGSQESKSYLIETIIESFPRRVSSHGEQVYTSICSQYHNQFGALIYQCLIKSMAYDVADREPHTCFDLQFLPSVKNALTSCSAEDLQTLGAALCVKPCHTKRGLLYKAKSPGSNRTFESLDLVSVLSKRFQADFATLHGLTDLNLVETFVSENFQSVDESHLSDISSLIFRILEGRGYPVAILAAIQTAVVGFVTTLNAGLPVPGSANDRKRLERKEARIQRVAEDIRVAEGDIERWPQPVDSSTIRDCLASYRESVQFKPFSVCSCCGADDRQRTGSYLPLSSVPCLEPLHVFNPYILQHTEQSRFKYIHKSLDGLLLEPKGIQATDEACNNVELYLCVPCHGALKKNSMPRLALNNDLYRGELPVDLQDLTWVEEMACALYRNTAHVARIFGSSSESDPLQMRGNTCAHPLDIFSNASTLPWSPADLNDLITIIFVGPNKLRDQDRSKLTPYVVRKAKIIAFLEFLRKHNKLYAGLPPPLESVLDLYPEHGLLPGLEERIIYDHETDPVHIFEEETSSFDQHPAELADSGGVFLETSGLYDPESNNIPSRNLTSSALRQIAIASNPESSTILHYDLDPVVEYNNPDLFPGMFPTLFPLGIAGFELSGCSSPVSLEMHAKHLLDLADRCFRYHYFYIFVVLNLIQRRKAHLHTSFSVKSSRFNTVAPALLSLHPDVLTSLATNMRDEHNPALFTPEEKNALLLLKEVNTISSKIPGSQASKILARHEIRSFFGHFGLPILFFTFNPSATHSPVFQVIFGDTEIDLDSEHPALPVTQSTRARNVAKDPVAAADFFEFMRTCLFQDLFGWDFNLVKSKPKGGIFGKMRAHYGACELTGRGHFHGHYLIWLCGAPNPSDIHILMRESEEYRDRFLAFFEGVIHHHLPDLDIDVDPMYEPRIEMPPHVPPNNLEDFQLQCAANEMWEKNFEMQHKKIGERHQRHRCRPVCHKGRKDQTECRFGFPHDLVEISRFEAESNSIIFSRREADVNGHNPHILVATRHNHDLKCILSGKAAKAAMFYISDYILKMPLTTEDLLSLLSKAVVSIPQDDVENTPTSRAKRLLHRCLTHFGRGTQIHAQHAARLLQGLNDTMSSHKTVPMPSGSLLCFLRRKYSVLLSDPESVLEEDMPVQLSLDKEGNLRQCNQVDDYFYRSPELEDITFYDFIRHFSCDRKSKSTTKHTSETRLGVLARYPLCDAHLNSQTHEITRHTFIEQGDVGPELVPRIVGAKIPRKGTVDYPLFCLAHFKPFSSRSPLLVSTVEDTFRTFEFSNFSLSVMKNWEDIHECQDEKEAERLRKQAQLMKSSTENSISMSSDLNTFLDIDEDVAFVDNNASSARNKNDLGFERESLHLQRNLVISKWLDSPTPSVRTSLQSVASESAPIAHVTKQLNLLWQSEIKSQAEVIARNRQSRSQPSIQVVDLQSVQESSNPLRHNYEASSDHFPPTQPQHQPVRHGPLSVEDVINQVRSSFQLNVKQAKAFHIISTTMVYRHVFKRTEWLEKDPLRLFLTGPGGTGKTHVVKAVKEVLRYFGMDHSIRFIAPIGGAANLIDGTTIHKGLGIAIKRDQHGFTKQIGEDNVHEVSFTVSNAMRAQLRSDWKDVLILMIDEISLVSLSLLAEIDAALCFAKEKPDHFYGNLNMIFSGDQFQFPPTVGRALYTPLTSYAPRTSEEGLHRLGRLAWNSNTDCISLDEQKRMEGDPEYGRAVARLRIRQCTQQDVDLFNSRVVKSIAHPDGVTMQDEEHYLAAMIVKSNKIRQRVNEWKATTVAKGVDGLQFTACAAQDRIVYAQDDLIPRTPIGEVPTADVQKQLLGLDMSSSRLHQSLPGLVHLYVGMPVVLKARNINTDLGVTNGARGYVKTFNVAVDANGHTFCNGCIVEFPDSKVHLDGLPPRCFPILPSTWTCSTFVSIPGLGSTKVKITRSQLPIQPGFAVTGHSAQGQTLLVVLCNLKEGSWAAYVSASRAKSRNGLFLTEPVTLEDLNSRAVPWDLWFETKRFEVLERNTRIKWSFISGETQPLPDAEANNFQEYGKEHYRFVFPLSHVPSGNKRQRGPTVETSSKKRRL